MPYEYKEYPKWVKDKDGKDVIANNAEEEATVTGNPIETEEPKSKKSKWDK